ncbi:MAG: triosephosphate isomerase [Planctomycetaceae bacterium]|nr:triosephosphate isomerase [Planctomycetaceae bacterium]
MRARRPFVAGNWKMNTTLKSATELAAGLAKLLPQDIPGVEVAVCPPAPYLIPVAAAIAGSGVKLGAQNCHSSKDAGAFTGEVALNMLQDVGCEYVILGHSERRSLFGETDAVVNAKVLAALGKGIKVILCVGEQLSERQANQTNAVLETQMAGSLANVAGDQLGNLVLAYEPVWAIGTGLTASPEQAESAHVFLRQWVANRYNPQIAETLRILYGGSVKGDNAKLLLGQPNIDGALVGGASLKVDQFWPIVAAGIEVGNG